MTLEKNKGWKLMSWASSLRNEKKNRKTNLNKIQGENKYKSRNELQSKLRIRKINKAKCFFEEADKTDPK